jgi:uncharacterized protein (UPF0332 family)
MTEDQKDLVQKAEESLSAAKVLFDSNFYGFAASRAYYAMFYVAQAFLEGDEVAFSKHSAVIGAFGRLFAQTGRVPAKFHRYLIEAQELRNLGDYTYCESVTEEQARDQIRKAEEFVDLGRRIVRPASGDDA